MTSEKQVLYDGLWKRLGMPVQRLRRGGTELKAPLGLLAKRVVPGVSSDLSKPELGRVVVEAADGSWDESCYSKGSTVTAEGLRRFTEAYDALVAGAPPDAGGGPGGPSGTLGRRAVKTDPETMPDRSSGGSVVVDLRAVDRGSRAHEDVRNRLIDWVESAEGEALEPEAGQPQFDLAWRAGEEWVVAEVKSTTMNNQGQQFRLGLGQVLEYMVRLHNLSEAPVRPVLVLEEPPEELQREVATGCGVVVTHPEEFDVDLAGLRPT